MDAFGLILPLFVVAVILIFGLQFVLQKRMRDAFEAFITQTDWELGLGRLRLDALDLGALDILEAGDRRNGVEFPAQRTLTRTIGGVATTAAVGVFTWWWETRSTDNDGNAQYSKSHTVVAVTTMPWVSPKIAIGSEGLFAKLGIGGRRDMQVESDEFNRQFRIDVADRNRPVAIRLLDAGFQQAMLQVFRTRKVEFLDQWVFLEGDTSRRSEQWPGRLGQYPGASSDLETFLGVVPAGYWRALGEPPAPTPPPPHIPDNLT